MISLHGGGPPEAMKKVIRGHYPVDDPVAPVERLLDRSVFDDGSPAVAVLKPDAE